MKKIFFLSSMMAGFGLFAADGAAPGGGMSQTLIMIGVALLFFYFLLWRPEQKRRKALEAQRGSMKKGDRVTAMGILGTIFKVSEKTVIVKLYDGAKMEVLKGAITEVLPGSEEEVEVEASTPA